MLKNKSQAQLVGENVQNAPKVAQKSVMDGSKIPQKSVIDEENNKNTSDKNTKKKRGRPVKQPEYKIVDNEDSKQINMSNNKDNNKNNRKYYKNKNKKNYKNDPWEERFYSQNQNSSIAQITPTNVKNSQNTLSVPYNNSNDPISLSMVQQRWGSIFGKYASLGSDALASAWAQGWGQLNNPFIQNYRIKQILALGQKMDQEKLSDAVNNPENNEMSLTRASMNFYYKNFTYNFLVKLNRETPMYKWYVTPQYIDAEEIGKDSFKKESQKVDRIMKKFKPALTFKTITTQVNLEGKSSYLPRISYDKDGEVNFFVLQKLNTDMVKLTGFGSKQQFIASFNMIIFLQPGYDVSQYPKYIRDVWEDMNTLGIIRKNDDGDLELNPLADIPVGHSIEWTGKYYIYWVQLPQELCYTFYSDGAHPNMFPDTIGLFEDLNDLDDYRWLQASLLSKGVNSVLTAQVPMVKDPKPGSDATAISPDTVLGYTDLFQQTVSGNILPFFAPFTNYELHTIESQPEALNVIYDRTRDLIATSGNASLLPITDKPSIASVKAAQNIQASKSEYLTRQYEQFLNNIINEEFGLKNKWKITLWGDIFNIREDAKNLKELVLTGMEGFLPKLLSAFDESLEDYKGNILYMKALDVKLEKTLDNDKMKLQSELNIKVAKENAKLNKTNNSNGSSSSNATKNTVKISDSNTTNTDTGLGNKVGRPKLNDSDIENDSTATSADAGNNVSDIKEFSIEGVVNGVEYVEDANEDIMKDLNYNTRRCIICGDELDYDEEMICDDCLEEKIEELDERVE